MRWSRAAVVCVVVSLVAPACSRVGEEERSAETTTTTTSAPSTSSTTSSTAPPTTTPTSTTSSARADSYPTGVITSEIGTSDQRVRTYRLFVPPDLPAREVPLLVALHGGTGWGAALAVQSGFDSIAAREGFVVVYPDGWGIGADGDQLRTWNGGDCCGPARNQGVDDVGFLDLLVDDLVTRFPIDERRIYATGHSNGGILAYRLACERPERFAAIGVFAATLGIDGCNPTSTVAFLHVHGLADRNLPLEGGVGPDSIAGVDFRSGVASIETIARANRCTGERTEPDPSNADVSRRIWTGCADGVEVRLVTVEDAGHRWMGGPQPDAYPDLSASLEIWEFVSRHAR
jgi:polyhydroxybutyrate depolymerase